MNPFGRKIILQIVWVVVAVWGIIMIAVVLDCICALSPTEHTRSCMHGIENRILAALCIGHDPESLVLANLPYAEGKGKSIKDGWGRPIMMCQTNRFQYIRNSRGELLWAAETNLIILFSYGRDGKPGGEGKDRDIFFEIPLCNYPTPHAKDDHD